MKIKCTTVFDCSCTGVTGHFKSSHLPFVDRSGKTVSTHSEWVQSRNQQRNYETLLQIFGLKTQPLDISAPTQVDGMWQFEFLIESPAVFAMTDHADPLAGLKQDCAGVPMIDNVSDVSQPLKLLSPDLNIWFEILNTATEN
jgi:hypothetical protein